MFITLPVGTRYFDANNALIKTTDHEVKLNTIAIIHAYPSIDNEITIIHLSDGRTINTTRRVFDEI